MIRNKHIGTLEAVSALVALAAVAMAITVSANRCTHTRANVQPQSAQVAAASNGLQELRQIARQMPDLWGFPSKQAIAEAKLEQPFDVCIGYLDTVANFKPATNPDSVMRCGGGQIYGVSAHGVFYSELAIMNTVDKGWIPGEWLKGGDHIERLSSLRLELAMRDRQAQSDYYLLDIPSMHQTFMASGHGAQMVIYPIADDTSLDVTTGQLIPAADLLGKLQPLAQRQIRTANGAPGN